MQHNEKVCKSYEFYLVRKLELFKAQDWNFHTPEIMYHLLNSVLVIKAHQQCSCLD